MGPPAVAGDGLCACLYPVPIQAAPCQAQGYCYHRVRAPLGSVAVLSTHKTAGATAASRQTQSHQSELYVLENSGEPCMCLHVCCEGVTGNGAFRDRHRLDILSATKVGCSHVSHPPYLPAPSFLVKDGIPKTVTDRATQASVSPQLPTRLPCHHVPCAYV